MLRQHLPLSSEVSGIGRIISVELLFFTVAPIKLATPWAISNPTLLNSNEESDHMMCIGLRLAMCAIFDQYWDGRA